MSSLFELLLPLQGRMAPLTVEESASGIVNLTHNLTRDQSGQFLNWLGEVVPY